MERSHRIFLDLQDQGFSNSREFDDFFSIRPHLLGEEFQVVFFLGGGRVTETTDRKTDSSCLNIIHTLLGEWKKRRRGGRHDILAYGGKDA